jgi:hypothetical protein
MMAMKFRAPDLEKRQTRGCIGKLSKATEAVITRLNNSLLVMQLQINLISVTYTSILTFEKKDLVCKW